MQSPLSNPCVSVKGESDFSGGGGVSSKGDLNQGVQPKKVRRLKETLFLREIERLADEMCKEAIPTDDGDSSSTRNRMRPQNYPTQISSSHIREHLSAIQEKIKDVITDVALPVQGGFSMGGSSSGYQIIDIEGGTTANSNRQKRHQEQQRQQQRQFAGSSPGSPSYDPVTIDDDDIQWDAQQVLHVSHRLRDEERIPAGSSHHRPKPPTVRGAGAGEKNLMVVRKFETGKAGSFGMLDVDMDGNTACLSARKKDACLQKMSLAMSTERLPAVIPSPRRPEVKTIIEEQRRRQLSSSSARGSRGSTRVSNGVAASRNYHNSTGKRGGGGGGQWSARDMGSTLATSDMRGRAKVPIPVPQLLLASMQDPIGASQQSQQHEGLSSTRGKR